MPALKKNFVLIIFYCAMPVYFALASDQDGLDISFDSAVYSKYIWRGFKLDSDLVLQSGLYIEKSGFNLSLWSNCDLRSRDSFNSDEVDYSISYSYGLKDRFDLNIALLFGYTYYDFPPAGTNSQEFFIGIGWDILLRPSLTWFHDFESESKGGGRGNYFAAELGHSVEIGNSPLTLDLSGHLGYNRRLFIAGDGFDAGLNIGLTFKVSDKISLSPSLGCSLPLGDLRASDDGNQRGEIFGGIALVFNL
ncbi:MAG: hypothetical protein PHQ54_02310 [Candidatus Omnitrophica bacterium]|nr:hypothetical protein [Candidatus Omnitrophota bacterium]